MAKVIDSVTIDVQMWSSITLSAEEIQDIYPEFANWNDGDDTDLIERAIEEHVDFNYLDLIQYADGALDECKITFEFEDDGGE
jgi:hypothetical protein